jgi:hypothetical protein
MIVNSPTIDGARAPFHVGDNIQDHSIMQQVVDCANQAVTSQVHTPSQELGPGVHVSRLVGGISHGSQQL